MTLKGEVQMLCDDCGEDVNDDLKNDETPQEHADEEDWGWTMFDNKFLCPPCLEKREPS